MTGDTFRFPYGSHSLHRSSARTLSSSARRAGLKATNRGLWLVMRLTRFLRSGGLFCFALGMPGNALFCMMELKCTADGEAKWCLVKDGR
jgi:hypothetical protein